MLFPGLRVFAKLKWFPPWPAYIQKTSTVGNKTWYLVVYYGHEDGKNMNWLQMNDIFLYNDYRWNTAVTKQKGKKYLEALKQIDDDVDGIVPDSDFAYLPPPPSRRSVNRNVCTTVKEEENVKDTSTVNLRNIKAVSGGIKSSRKSTAEDRELFLKTLNIVLQTKQAETELLLLESFLKAALPNQENFNLQAAISHLNRISEMNISPLVILKNPELLVCLKKITEFKDYGFERNEDDDARLTLLKSLAEKLVQKFKQTCNPNGRRNKAQFENFFRQFQKNTENLTRKDYVSIVTLSNNDDLIGKAELLEYYRQHM